MDGAWALYEAWVKLQHGDVDTALVYSLRQVVARRPADVLTRQLDPYYVAPLWPDSVSLAALQARACSTPGTAPRSEMAEVAARSRRDAQDNPYAQLSRRPSPWTRC